MECCGSVLLHLGNSTANLTEMRKCGTQELHPARAHKQKRDESEGHFLLIPSLLSPIISACCQKQFGMIIKMAGSTVTPLLVLPLD